MPIANARNHAAPMAKRRSSTIPRIFRHRNLVASEGLLLVAVLQEVIQRWVNGLEIANWGKALFMMAVNLGALGILLVFVQIAAEKSLSKTHAAVQAIPFPTPYLLIHSAVFIAIFYLHAYVWDVPVWPMYAR